MRLKEFWEARYKGIKLVIHCKEEWQAKKLCCEFDKLGKKWCNGDSYLEETDWEYYKENTCYSNSGGYCYLDWYEENGYTIYELEEIDDFNFKVGDRVRVRQWDDLVNEYGITKQKGIVKIDGIDFTEDMKKECCGKKFTITGFEENTFLDLEEIKKYVSYKICGWDIPAGCLEKVYEDDKKQYCIVTNDGQQYRTYSKYVEKYFEEYIDLFESGKKIYDDENKKYVVVGKHKHTEYEDRMLYLIQDEEENKVYVIGEEGIEILGKEKAEEKGKERNIMSTITIKYGENFFSKVKTISSLMYSFRFNEERKSVTLYENGNKVQFVKPQKEDKFNWKIGLGVALYKQLYKTNNDVNYVKTIVNEKTFYNYCVARFFYFDKQKVETLEQHVKDCKRKYCEFQLSNILYN